MEKKWQTLSKTKKIKPEEIVKILLENRGLKSKKTIDEFLKPTDPYTLDSKLLGIKKTEVNKVVKRIKKAISSKESIIVYGDYDADGICATAIVWETLHGLGAKVLPFIPNREKHGYGLKKTGIDSLLKSSKQEPPTLLITVDNGIVAHQGVEYANKKGMDVVITDHHQKAKTLPKAHSIFWSDQTSGAGVAWFLAKEIYQAFHKSLQGFKASNSLELACIGSITDQMEVLNINRSLIKYGLEELRQSQRPGILALCSQAVVRQNQIGMYEIGFIIGPRLNAMGRLEDGLDSLRLLCTKKNARANGLAQKLGSTNRQRQELTHATFEHAKKSSKPKAKKAKVLVVSHGSYNQGVIGLVAGRLVEEFYRPSIVIAKEGDYSKGSARSISGFNMIKNLRKLKNIFEDLGGHPMAAGFTIQTKKIPQLKQKLEKLARKEIKKKLLQPIIKADLEIGIQDIDWKLFNAIEKFSPFGLGNPQPKFISRQVELVSSRAVGRDSKHLKSRFQVPGSKFKVIDAIAFNFGHLSVKLKPNQKIDVLYSLEKNVWNGKKNLELKVRDIEVVT